MHMQNFDANAKEEMNAQLPVYILQVDIASAFGCINPLLFGRACLKEEFLHNFVWQCQGGDECGSEGQCDRC